MSWLKNFGSSLASGGASLVSGGLSTLFNWLNSNAANKLQYKMFQEGNEFTHNERIDTQNWNEEMWNKANAYNTPSAQIQRYLDAGINPYMAVGNVSSGNAESLSGTSGSSVGVPSAHTADFSGLSQYGADVSANFRNAQNIEADKKLKAAMADNYESQSIATIDRNAREQTILGKQLPIMIKQGEFLDQQIKDLQSRIDQRSIQNFKTLLDADAQKILNNYLSAEKQLALASTIQDIYNKHALGLLTEQQYKHEIQNTIAAQLDNKLTFETIDNAIELANKQAGAMSKFYDGFGSYATEAGAADALKHLSDYDISIGEADKSLNWKYRESLSTPAGLGAFSRFFKDTLDDLNFELDWSGSFPYFKHVKKDKLDRRYRYRDSSDSSRD